MNPLPEVVSQSSDFGLGSDDMPARKGGLRRLNPLEEPQWDKRVISHPDSAFFHGMAWAKVLHDTYGHAPSYFTVTEGERLSALLPMMEVHSPFTGRRGVALPFTDECPALTSASVPAADLVEQAMEFGRERRWKYLECRGGGCFPKPTPSSVSFFGHALKLCGHEDRIFRGFAGSVRQAVQKARKARVCVEFSDSLESVRTFYALHCKTRKQKHGLPPQPFLFFQRIFEHILCRGMGFVALARYEQKPIAAALFFHLGDKAIYKSGASDPAFQHLRGNNLVMWEAIKWYSRQGYASLHFGRTSIANDGLRRFKLSLGATEYGIDYYKYDFGKEAFVADRDKAFGWFNRVFRLMPTPLSRKIGTLLYKHLA